MNDNAKKWVAALRSGEYKQTKGWLHSKKDDEDRYCCLGVACVLAEREGVVKRLESSDIEVMGYPPEEHNRWGSGEGESGWSGGVLPRAVQKWLGLQTDAGDYLTDDDNDGDALAHLNDSGYSFSEIADKIEEEPHGLFDD